MKKHVFRSQDEPVRQNPSWHDLWRRDDGGLIGCWEAGRTLREEQPDLAERAEEGELPILVWKGGVEKRLKVGHKYGSLFYLAQWQGLRNEDLNIFTDSELDVNCSRTEMTVTFTGDVNKFKTG